VLEGTAQGRTGATPYVEFGNRGMLAMVVLALLAAVLIDRRRRLLGRGGANMRVRG
jgi:apolipoprotein N-acyltransferase